MVRTPNPFRIVRALARDDIRVRGASARWRLTLSGSIEEYVWERGEPAEGQPACQRRTGSNESPNVAELFEVVYQPSRKRASMSYVTAPVHTDNSIAEVILKTFVAAKLFAYEMSVNLLVVYAVFPNHMAICAVPQVAL